MRQIKCPSFERLLGKFNNTYRIIFCFIRISIQCRFCDHFLKMVSGKWCPSFAMQCWRRYLKFRLLFGTSQGGNAVISSRIRIFNSSKLCGWLLNTFSFTYPHRKKLQMLKSGERAGHSIWPYSFEETEREHSIGDWGNDQCRPINVHAQNKARSSECRLSLLQETTEWMFPKNVPTANPRC